MVVVKGPTGRNDVLKMIRKKGWFQFILDPGRSLKKAKGEKKEEKKLFLAFRGKAKNF